MVDLRHSANGSPSCEGLDGDLHHWGGGLVGKLYQAGKKTLLGRVDVGSDGEERVHEKHTSVRVKSDHCHLLQDEDQDHPRC